jgi:HicA toxin of bacterial toxin-antitoxin,
VNSKQAKTLKAIFREPVSPSIVWADVETLLIAIGCRRNESAGSRVRFDKDGEVETFHRPHNAKESKQYKIRLLRAYLLRLGVEP